MYKIDIVKVGMSDEFRMRDREIGSRLHEETKRQMDSQKQEHKHPRSGESGQSTDE